MQAEVFVFTKNELAELIKNIQIETSTSIREQITIVNNFKIEECIKSIKAIELDDDWFIIPNELFEEFKEDENNEMLVESGGFDDKWRKYKTGGDLNLIQLYIKQNNQ